MTDHTRIRILLPTLALCAGLAIPAIAPAAIPLAGDALEVYGRVHLSLDLSETDVPGDDLNLGVSSNNSLIGFRGQHALDPRANLLWQLESGYRADSASGSFATRNTFLGVENPDYGTVIAGYHDTPFKYVAKRWAVLSDTVADRRMILGSGNGINNAMNARGKSSIQYMNRIRGLEFRVMYAADTVDANGGSGPDDNDNRLISAGAWYTVGALDLSAAYERWSNLAGTVLTGAAAAAGGSATGLRLAASHKVGGNARLGVLFETIDTSANALAGIDRNALGFNGSLRQGALTFDAQLLFAGDHRGQGNSGAINLGFGVTRAINSQLDVYGAFSLTDNDSNAAYNAVGGGHGDLVPTTAGGRPYVFSAGAQFRF